MTNLKRATDEKLWNEIEICRAKSKKLAGKKGRDAYTDASRNAEYFGEIIKELKRRGLC